ncbi:MAG TPA: ATP-binding protein [Gemmatimonadales bacterium]|nr:ATP-binding protein [Gemmatimonadales bacterium]
MNFAGRLILGILAVIVVVIVTLVTSAELSLRQKLEDDIRNTLEREARLIAQALPADSLAWQAAVEDLARTSQLRVTLIDREGRVLAESDEPAEAVPRIENHKARPEVAAAIEGKVGSSRRVSATVNRPLLYVAIPGGPGVVRVAAPLLGVDEIIRRTQTSIIDAAGIALLLGLLLAFVAGRSVARPLNGIREAARAIADGATPHFPHSGVPDIDGVVRSLRDMHVQLDERFNQIKRERAESAALVESMAEGVIASDDRGHIVTANAAARRLLGYDPDENLPALDQLFRVKAAREMVDALLAGRTAPERELELDGHTILLSGRALAHGGALLVLHDVTDLRRLEIVRRDFVANVSHELKTPLTSISGYAETLVNDPPDAEMSRRFLNVILANARRMQRLVDGLLDLSRIESGGWRPEPESLEATTVAREVWALMADRAAQREVGFDIQIEPGAERVHADPDAFRQVLTNLLDNALRYTPAGGKITLRMRREAEGIRVGVKDTGAGITSEHLGRIFERFYRADSARSRDEGGTGLGLAIVKHLVEAHDGRVEARSEVGKGTEIISWFPDPTGAVVAKL